MKIHNLKLLLLLAFSLQPSAFLLASNWTNYPVATEPGTNDTIMVGTTETNLFGAPTNYLFRPFAATTSTNRGMSINTSYTNTATRRAMLIGSVWLMPSSTNPAIARFVSANGSVTNLEWQTGAHTNAWQMPIFILLDPRQSFYITNLSPGTATSALTNTVIVK